VKTALFDFAATTCWTFRSGGPAHFTDRFITFSVIDKVLELDIGHLPILPTQLCHLLDFN